MAQPTIGEMPQCQECVFRPTEYAPTDEERAVLDKFMLMCAATVHSEEGYELVQLSAEEAKILQDFRDESFEKKMVSQNAFARGNAIGAGRCAIWGYDPKQVAFYARADRQSQNYSE